MTRKSRFQIPKSYRKIFVCTSFVSPSSSFVMSSTVPSPLCTRFLEGLLYLCLKYSAEIDVLFEMSDGSSARLLSLSQP